MFIKKIIKIKTKRKMCKSNFVHVAFIIDESGSMSGKEKDVIGGFKTVVDEQRENKNGTCSVSFYKFQTDIEKIYLGKDVNNVEYIDGQYRPHGCTALFDAVGIAIDEIGKWLNDMKEDERPEKNIIVIMTDGEENSSKEYTASKIKEMIKHQEDKYNWTFVYMGSDLKDAKDANSIGIKTRFYSTSADYNKNYDVINLALSSYRCMTGSTEEKSCYLTNTLTEQSIEVTKDYAEANGLDAETLLKND